MARYAGAQKLGHECPARFGINTGDNQRFTRSWWEGASGDLYVDRHGAHPASVRNSSWVPL